MCRILVLLVGAMSHSSASFSGSFYVALDGDDSWSGTLPSPSASGDDGPFRNPAAAALAVQALPRPLSGDVKVQLRAGVYALNSTLVLGSGGDGPGARVIWSSYPADGAGTAVLSGGLPLSSWTRDASRPGIWVSTLPAAAPARTRSLFVNGARRWPARVPAISGTARSDFASDASTLQYVSSLDGCGFSPAACWGNDCSNASHAVNDYGFIFNASDPRSPSASWSDVAGVDVLSFGAWTAAWAPVRAVFSDNATLLTSMPLSTARPGSFGGKGCPAGARYILFNVAEALVAGSGAYYVDDVARTVSFAPLAADGDPNSLDIIVPALDVVVRVQGSGAGSPVAALALQDLNVSYASDVGQRYSAYMSPSGAVTLSAAADVSLTRVDVSASDGCGVLLLNALVRVRIDGCTVRDVGSDGIGITFGLSADALNTTISRSTVDGVGFIFHNQPGGMRVMGDASGTVNISYNHVRDSSYAGIMIGWQDGTAKPSPSRGFQFVVSNNLVEDCGNQILSDFGGIYISTSGEQCEATETCYLPTLVQSNLVRNVRGYNYGGEGIYFDENVAGVTVIGNGAYFAEWKRQPVTPAHPSACLRMHPHTHCVRS